MFLASLSLCLLFQPFDPLAAGAAAAPITPSLAERPVYLAGYDAGRRATAVHDDLWARAVVIQAAGVRLAIVALDLIGFFLNDVEAVETRLAAEHGIDYLLLASTHTHSGPDTLGLWGETNLVSGRSPAYVSQVQERVLDVVREACHRLVPARIAFGEKHVPGLIRDSRPPWIVDDLLQIMALDTLAGEPIALLTCFPVHPEVLGRRSTLLSSDFPHFLRALVERERGGVAVHVSGSIGGLLAPTGKGLVDPQTGQPPPGGSLEMMRLYGERLGREALALAAAAPLLDGAPVAGATREVFIPLENGMFRLAVALGVLGSGRPVFTAGEPDDRRSTPLVEGFPAHALGKDLKTRVSVITVGPATFAAVPGELYPEITLGSIPLERDPGRDYPDAAPEAGLRALLPGQYRIVVGLANDEIGYIIPRSQWDEEPPWTFGMTRRPYGEINSVGPSAAPLILEAFAAVVETL